MAATRANVQHDRLGCRRASKVRVFRDESVPDIAQAVFAGYVPFANRPWHAHSRADHRLAVVAQPASGITTDDVRPGQDVSMRCRAHSSD